MKSGFDSDMFQKLAKIEHSNFWFRSRNDIICWVARKYCSKPKKILEIGCGTGYVTQALGECFPHAEITGSEFLEEGLRFAQQRNPGAKFIQLDARQLDVANQYDLIGAFDVLEHIEEDEAVIRNVANALTRRGVFLVTVPQHRWLWSGADVSACHVRRYIATELRFKLEKADMKILYQTSFVSLLLPLVFLSRRLLGKAKGDQSAELDPPRLINGMLWLVLQLELVFIKMGLRMPFGSSLLVVAERSPHADKAV